LDEDGELIRDNYPSGKILIKVNVWPVDEKKFIAETQIKRKFPILAIVLYFNWYGNNKNDFEVKNVRDYVPFVEWKFPELRKMLKALISKQYIVSTKDIYGKKMMSDEFLDIYFNRQKDFVDTIDNLEMSEITDFDEYFDD
jgi:hypothetical protein